MKMLLIITLTVILNNVIYAEKSIPLELKKKDKIVFYGDSITHQNYYPRYLALLFYTRYPNLPLTFYNAGVSGNKTSSGLNRFRQDIVDKNPNLTFIMFGMNDAYYKPYDEKIFQKYIKNYNTILSKLKKETKSNAILLTPTFYDYQARLRAEEKTGRCESYNKTLQKYGTYLKELGKKENYKVIDLNSTMAKVTEQLRKIKKTASLTKDGIHPNPMGHFVITYDILKAIGISPIVASVDIDFKDPAKFKTENCKITKLKIKDSKIGFDLLAESLPYPIPTEVEKIVKYIPFLKELNQEVLKVTNLPKGTYKLLIDGSNVGSWSENEFNSGVNIAENPKTPQFQQAQKILKLSNKLHNLMLKHRDFRWMEKQKGYKKTDGSYPRKIAEFDVSGKSRQYPIINNKRKVEFISFGEWKKLFAKKAGEDKAILLEIANIESEIYKTNQPKNHHYIIKKLK